MASYTTNLTLLKKDPETDASDTFNIQTMLNDNWDKIDTAVNEKIPNSLATESDQAIVSTGSGVWVAKTLAQFKTWLALTASSISDFAANVNSTVLTGLSTATSSAITTADTVLSALGKLQAQFTAHTGDTSNPHGVTSEQIGAAVATEVYSKTEALSASTKTIYGLESDAIPDDALEIIGNKLPAVDKNFLNILRLKLQQSLSASDIDAWADLLADTSMIDAGASSGYTISGGKALAQSVTIQQATNTSTWDFGKTTTYPKVAQTFTATLSGNLFKARFKIKKTGSPTDGMQAVLRIYDGTMAGTIVATSAVVSAASISTSLTDIDFIFTSAAVSTSGLAMYQITLERTGSLSDSAYYSASYNSSGGYADGEAWYYNGNWSQNTSYDLYFAAYVAMDATVVWNSVTASEAPAYAAVAAEETLNSGSITWYLSDDGTNWTEITAPDTMQTVGFDAVSVYLKCVITGDAEVDAVAWGGY